ncbi:MAG TPA: exodeoxyribonuclease VII large subunit, partial [Candidatus Binataceae bacterium]|nr:exodeoxyribonuclease VII large subunit [Candidatus Binataceae bacterium]
AREHVDETSQELTAAINHRVADARRVLREHGARVRPPGAMAREVRIRARELSGKMTQAMTLMAHRERAAVERASTSLLRAGTVMVEKHRGRLGSLATQLDATSPLKCLERGYAVVTNLRDGRAAMDAQTVQVGDELEIRLRRGKLRARTESREL